MSAPVTSRALIASSIAGSALVTPLRIAVVALAAAFTAAAAQFTTTVPFTAVPFTLTPIAVLLTGAALGSRLGAMSQVVYVVSGVAGLAVFAPSATLPPGVLRVLGPTGGYLMAYPVAAFVTGWLAEQGWDRRYVSAFLAMLAGLGVIYAGGVSWLALAHVGAVGSALTIGLAPFVLLDVLKLAAAAMLLPKTWRLAGRRLG
ncbi:MAG: biotin transporter BioY [Acidobacteria bacterium]|nr:biotin transporter BioY [Acidobacteriota bacterium]